VTFTTRLGSLIDLWRKLDGKSTPHMDANIKQKWVGALRSGKYKQGYNCLRNRQDGFCCFGVLCDVINPGGWNQDSCGFYSFSESSGLPPQHIQDEVGIPKPAIGVLVEMNDYGDSFEQIAAYIEGNL
jgi:hypothetical protein